MAKVKHKKKIKTRHYFFLNPYEDCAFTRCPKCNNKTKIRKFPLVIHIVNRMYMFKDMLNFAPMPAWVREETLR